MAEDSLSTIDGESNVGSSVSRFASESEEETESDSDDEEEEAEPKLKYERLSSDLKAILKKDVASCLAVHSKFLILGTHWGVIHILDAMGNCLPSRQSQAWGNILLGNFFDRNLLFGVFLVLKNEFSSVFSLPDMSILYKFQE